MHLDTLEFPLVRMRQSSSDLGDPFTETEKLLERREPFVLLSDEGLGERELDDDHEHSREEFKQMTLWMKRHKREIRTYIKAAIYVERNAAKRVAGKAYATIFGKFWGFPLLIVKTSDEALALVREKLAESSES